MAKLANKDQILAASDQKFEDIEVPEWTVDGAPLTVRISTMSGTARDAWELQQYAMKDGGLEVNQSNIRARLIAATAVDEDGELIFTAEEITALGRKSAKALDRLYAVASRLNGLRKKDIDELVKP